MYSFKILLFNKLETAFCVCRAMNHFSINIHRNNDFIKYNSKANNEQKKKTNKVQFGFYQEIISIRVHIS